MACNRLILALLTGVVLAVPSPRSLRSEVTILSDNDLQGPDGPGSAFGALYLTKKQSFKEAVASCEALGEELWTPGTYGRGIEIVGQHLEDRQAGVESPRAWVSSDGNDKQVITNSGELVVVDETLRIPVLCTQTAPFSNNTFEDKDERWQVQVQSNNEVLTGLSFRDRLAFRFFGVRFAPKPKRFTYPVMHNGSGEVVSALDYGSQCFQGSGGSEDCLFLNIWTPHLPPARCATKQLKPVMLWLYGGGFASGTANDKLFDGANTASRGDVVMVAVSYRVAAFGYLALSDGVTNGNYGLADQILGLEWVRKNIQDFGGDPERITVFGQSAGAASVRAIMASPKAVGKFAAALPMSSLGGLQYGAPYAKYYTIEEQVEVAANSILKATNCSNAASQVDCLRRVDAKTLLSVSDARYLVVDGTYLTSDELPLDGGKAPYRLMMGIAADDGAPFVTFTANLTADDDEWLPNQGLPNPPRSLFPVQDLRNETLAMYRMGSRLATDAMYRCIDQATAYAGLKNGVFDEVYYYEFDRTYQMRDWPKLDICEAPRSPEHPFGDPNAEIGYSKCHSGELFYVFGNLKRMGMPYRDEKGDREFEREVNDRWTSFAWGRSPNLASTSDWEPAVADNLRLLSLDWPRSTMTGFRDFEQCQWLELPLDYYLQK
ncbi:Bile salt-activated lipase [Paramyrothecium foliicola]|nr:Bile salt-activated lipase [Paramyrothecium foliicola]